MTYIYDVLLNFTDDERLIEFFEWEERDSLEHIKRIPIIRISSDQLAELIQYEVEVDKDFLEQIKSKTQEYKNTNNLEYATLITDLNKVVALEFNNKGKIISRSSLLLDEEDEIIEESLDLPEEKITYSIKQGNAIDRFLTREELKKKRYLLKEIENLYSENNTDKLKYLYEELYEKTDISFKEMYQKLKKDLEENYSLKHNNLYEIVRLTYIKK